MLWVLTAVAVALGAVFVFLKVLRPLNHWKEKGVPHEQPWPIFGNMAQIAFWQKAFSHLLQDYYTKFSSERYCGFYQFLMPTLMIRDPELIKQICIKDFDTFSDHQEFLPQSSDPFWSRNLLSMTGKKWHEMRCVLSPAFTSSKMKGMFAFMAECAKVYVDHFKQQKGTVTLEMKDTFMRLANDIIASTAFGIKCDSLKDRNNEFFEVGKNAFNFNGLRSLKFFGYALSPTLTRLLKIKFIDAYTQNFLHSIVMETIQHREKEGIVRPDMIHLLKEAQKGRLKHETDTDTIDSGFAVARESKSNINDAFSVSKAGKNLITDEDVAAQAMIFFFGGFDTVATFLSHLAYEIAVNPDAQRKLIEEVDETLERCSGKLTYEALVGMKYLDMVTSETLRLWSPGVVTNRKTLKPYRIEPTRPGEKPLVIEEGTAIWFPVYAIHRDPKYYENPDKFDPERFSDANKHNIQPFTYLPFGIGPRSCIASRFALLEAKTVIVYLLTEFEFVPVEKTKIPFVLSKSNINMSTDYGYWLGLKPRTKRS